MPAAPRCRYHLRMLVEVLGLPDDRTAALEAVLGEALVQLGLSGAATVRRIEDAGAMVARGVRQPPALRVDGRVVCRRRVPSVREVRAYLEEAAEA
jgi:Thioredoxin domain